MKKKILIQILCLFLGNISLPVMADDLAICHGRMVNPFTSFCWKCLLPITIGKTKVASTDLPDTANPSNPLCSCPGHPFPHVGIKVGFWEPIGFVDVTRTPYCMVNMGGIRLAHESGEGTVETKTPSQGGAFYYVHYYTFPLLQILWLKLFGGSCQENGKFSIGYLSELDPTWKNETLAALLFPETKLYQNTNVAIAAHASCAMDAIASNSGLSQDQAYWCAGSHGFMYPLTGKVVEAISILQAQTLLVERVLYKLHRLGQMTDSDPNHVCTQTYYPFMPKSRYRTQMIYPKIENTCHPFGRSTPMGGGNIFDLASGDEGGFMIWRKKNCCQW